VYSSIAIISALLSRVVLGRELNYSQWIAVVVVSFGLSISVAGVNTPSTNTQLLGIFVTLLSTTIYSCNYVFIEKTLATNINGQSLQYTAGCLSVCLCSLYVFIFTAPNWDTLLTMNIQQANGGRGGNLTIILSSYAMISLSALGHSWAFYKLLVEVGCVSTGLLQSLRAVVVFFVSSALFCSVQEIQCLTPAKVLSSLIVVSGTIFYSSIEPTKLPQKDEKHEIEVV